MIRNGWLISPSSVTIAGVLLYLKQVVPVQALMITVGIQLHITLWERVSMRRAVNAVDLYRSFHKRDVGYARDYVKVFSFSMKHDCSSLKKHDSQRHSQANCWFGPKHKKNFLFLQCWVVVCGISSICFHNPLKPEPYQ